MTGDAYDIDELWPDEAAIGMVLRDHFQQRPNDYVMASHLDRLHGLAGAIGPETLAPTTRVEVKKSASTKGARVLVACAAAIIAMIALVGIERIGSRTETLGDSDRPESPATSGPDQRGVLPGPAPDEPDPTEPAPDPQSDPSIKIDNGEDGASNGETDGSDEASLSTPDSEYVSSRTTSSPPSSTTKASSASTTLPPPPPSTATITAPTTISRPSTTNTTTTTEPPATAEQQTTTETPTTTEQLTTTEPPTTTSTVPETTSTTESSHCPPFLLNPIAVLACLIDLIAP